MRGADFNQFKQLRNQLVLFKLYSFNKKIPEILDVSDVDSHFKHIFDVSQSQHRRARVGKGSNKKSFTFKLFQFCDLKTQQRYILQKEGNNSRRELSSLVNSSHDFLKLFDQATKCLQFPLSKPKSEIGSTKSEDNLFLLYYKDIIEYPQRQIRLSFPFQNKNSCVFFHQKN